MPMFSDPSLFANLFNPQNANAPDTPSSNIKWPQFRAQPPLPSESAVGGMDILPGQSPTGMGMPSESDPNQMDKFQLMLKLAVPLIAAGMAFKKGTGPAIGGLGEGYMSGEKLALQQKQQAADEFYQRDLVSQRREAAKQTSMDKLQAKADAARKALAEHQKAIRDYDDKTFLRIAAGLKAKPGGFEHLNELWAKGQDASFEYQDADGNSRKVSASDLFKRVGELTENGQLVGGTEPAKPERPQTALDYEPGSDVGTVVPVVPGAKVRARSRPPIKPDKPDKPNSYTVDLPDPDSDTGTSKWRITEDANGKEVSRRKLSGSETTTPSTLGGHFMNGADGKLHWTP
jgi:hypothetical protein